MNSPGLKVSAIPWTGFTFSNPCRWQHTSSQQGHTVTMEVLPIPYKQEIPDLHTAPIAWFTDAARCLFWAGKNNKEVVDT